MIANSINTNKTNNNTARHIKCATCNKRFGTQSDMLRHVTMVHNLSVKKPILNRKQNMTTELTQGGVRTSAPGPSVNKLAKLLPADIGSTDAGRAWALKCLHPNSESNSRAMGIPDNTSLPVALPETRTEITVRAPTNLDGTPLAPDVNWDCYVIVPDTVEVAAVVVTKPSNVEWSALKTTLNEADVKATAPVINYFPLFGDGVITGMADQYRTTSRGLTVHMDSNFINNQGMVYADNWPSEGFNSSAKGAGSVSSIRTRVEKLPLMNPGAMVQRSPRCYVGNARDGVYVVSYPVQSSVAIPYHTQSDTEPEEGDSGEGAYWTTFLYPDEHGAAPSVLGDAAHRKYMATRGSVASEGGYTCAVALFTGLSSAANLQLKVRQGLELVPTDQTPMQAFTGASPLLDRVALDAVARVAQQSAGAYPASYNDLSKILGNVWQSIKGIVKPVSEIANFASGSGIPVISDVGGIIKDVLSFLG